MTHVHVDARRWFERTNGNTYHSVSVVVDGEPVGVAPFVYGYGDHYLHTAGEILMRARPALGLVEAYDLGRWATREDLGISLTTDCVDVPRKRDLHNAGRAL